MVKVNRDFLKESYNIDDLVKIVAILRGENGCPWDREQTHKSIRNDLLEEAYEVADAIDRGDNTDLIEELGDLLLQVVFHSQIGVEEKAFDLNVVADGICKKLVYRHPHVFANVKAETSEEVLDNWDKLKKTEKHMSSYTETLKAVPSAFPALMRSQKVQKRAAKSGYDFLSLEDTVLKLEEELKELKEAIIQGDRENAAEELGDLIFSAVNTARFLKVDSEEQLSLATEKFISRFEEAEALANKEGKPLNTLSPAQLDDLWKRVKEN
ncbi:MAG: nucleoside triphosphate pyrophosphohydrolase [Clostridia bacterium]|nr:nucleoside triphosphate pyrophosphohydrolase [Clostridia bacterium]